MPLTKARRTKALNTCHRPELLFVNGPDEPVIVGLGAPSMTDRYEIGPAALHALSTSVLQPAFEGVIGVGLTGERPNWESWLPELETSRLVQAADPRSEVGRQIEEIQWVTGLNDAQLAEAFPGGVTRETVNRWRNRPDPNLRPENLYRLGILHELAQQVEHGGIDARVWLHQPFAGNDQTPFMLMCAGRLADVRRAVDAIAAGVASATTPMSAPTITRDSDVVAESDEDDEGEWIWQESNGDGSE